jgi:hypothetical protein
MLLRVRTAWAAGSGVLLLFLAACASEDEGSGGPRLSSELIYRRYSVDPSGTVNTDSQLELRVAPSGSARSVVRRSWLSDLNRRGSLSSDDLDKLCRLLGHWEQMASAVPAAPSQKVSGILEYGARRVQWARDTPLADELRELIHFLDGIEETLSIQKRR